MVAEEQGGTASVVRRLLDAIPFFAFLVDRHYRIAAANKSAISQFQKNESLVGAFCPRAIHGLTAPCRFCPLEDVIEYGHSESREFYDGTSGCWLRVQIHPTELRSDDGEPLFLHFAENITDQMQAKAEVQRSYQIQSVLANLRGLSDQNLSLDHMLDRALEHLVGIRWLPVTDQGAIFIMDPDRDLLVMKSSRGLPVGVRTACAQVPLGHCLCGKAALSREPEPCLHGEVCHSAAEMNKVDHGHYCVPMVSAGSVLGVICFYLERDCHLAERDLDFLRAVGKTLGSTIERRRAEESRSRLIAILEATSDLVAVFDAAARLSYVNPAGRQLLGLAADEEIRGRSIADYVSEQSKAAFLDQAVPAAFENGLWTGETMIRSKDGSDLPASQVILAHRSTDGTSRYLSTIVRDTRDQHEARKRLAESEKKYRSLFEDSVDVVFSTALDGRILELNPAGIALFGCESKEEMLGLDAAQFMYANPSDRARFQAAVAADGFVRGFELQFKKKDGSPLNVLVTATAVHDTEGTLVGYQGFISDRTEQKRLEQQFLHAQKMEAVGLLAGGVAHDFNNVLMTISGYSSLLQSEIPADSPLSEDVTEIQEAVRRGAALTRQLLAFSRKHVADPQDICVNETIGAIANMLQRLVGEHIRLELELASDPSTIRIDPIQLEQVLINLVINARDAMPAGGVLQIVTSIAHFTPDDPSFSPGSRPRDYLVIQVSDTGMGMTEDVRQRAFEPFYTTKPVGKGTGLGLPMVMRTIRQAGGHVDVDSSPGVGTTFRLLFPIQEACVGAMSSIPPSVIPRGSGQRVLIVEDDPSVRRSTARVLTNFGYRTLEAAGLEEALLAARESPDSIDAVLSDVVLPNSDAKVLLNRLREAFPTTPILLLSGYADDDVLSRLEIDPSIVFLSKPVEERQLLRTVSQIIPSQTPAGSPSVRARSGSQPD